MSQNVWGLQVDQVGQRDTLKAYSWQLEETERTCRLQTNWDVENKYFETIVHF